MNLASHLSIDQAAERLGVSPAAVGVWIRKGVIVVGRGLVKLAAVRVGTAWRIAPESLDLFVAACSPAPVAAPANPAAAAGRRRKASAALAAEIGGGS